ncbi:hypothetical protein SISSUDRAFT_1127991 [Sistotremastrum suecicum HHB10207 ss-3]|uniref:Ricin B lectin domain-containing protein n=1 Tax=Sistotremastrum suecicum HHB10207 ss-3 TaxID=1314776 RepID=A0A166EDY8_9AGAM|nr:hypothetical protein SISSUDRAFT_1127991 [Sistotremastrum suecicum HHB10207 ss-3]
MTNRSTLGAQLSAMVHLDDGLYTIQNAFAPGFLRNYEKKGRAVSYSTAELDESTVFKVTWIAGTDYTIMLDQSDSQLYITEAASATDASGKELAGGPYAAMTDRYSEVQLQEAQSGTFRMGTPFSGTYFTLSRCNDDKLRVSATRPNGESKNLWVFVKRVRLQPPGHTATEVRRIILAPSD